MWSSPCRARGRRVGAYRCASRRHTARSSSTSAVTKWLTHTHNRRAPCARCSAAMHVESTDTSRLTLMRRPSRQQLACRRSWQQIAHGGHTGSVRARAKRRCRPTCARRASPHGRSRPLQRRADVRDESSRHEGHVGERWKSLAKFTKALERHEADRRVSHVDFHCFPSKKLSKMVRIGRRGARRARHVSRRTSKCLICVRTVRMSIFCANL